jgi:hypothetical protein
MKLNLPQTKILKIAQSLVNPREDIEKYITGENSPPVYKLTVEEFMKLLEIKANDRLKYDEMPNFLNTVMKHDTFMYRKNKHTMRSIHMFDSFDYDEQKREVSIRFSWSMTELLSSKKKGKFQTYPIKNILSFKSLYTLQIFEILKRELRGRTFIEYSIEVDELRDIFNMEDNTYPKWADFKRYVVDKCVEEINNNPTSFMIVEYETKRKGRVISTIIFQVKNIKPIPELPEEIEDKPDAVDVEYEEYKKEQEKDKEKDCIDFVKGLIKEDLTDDEIKFICKDAKGNVSVIEDMYNIMKTQNIDNGIVGWMRVAVRNPEKYKMPKKREKESKFNNFKARDYNFQNLEKALLGWDDVSEEDIHQEKFI